MPPASSSKKKKGSLPATSELTPDIVSSFGNAKLGPGSCTGIEGEHNKHDHCAAFAHISERVSSQKGDYGRLPMPQTKCVQLSIAVTGIGTKRLPDCHSDVGERASIDDDPFESANNSFLRNAQLSKPRPAVALLDAGDDWRQAQPRPVAADSVAEPRFHDEESIAVACTDERGGEIAQAVKQAVEQTWKRANTVREQAVRSAMEAAAAEARTAAAAEVAAVRLNLKEATRAEIDSAKTQIWDMAARERDRAVQAALEKHKIELERTKQELEKEVLRRKQQHSALYSSVRAELEQQLQVEHEARIAAAVQTTWDRAGKQQDRAVEMAVEETREELKKELEAQLMEERMKMRADARRTVQDSEEGHAELARRNRDEIKKLRDRLAETERLLQEAREETARTEKKCAEEQMRAVKEAIEAVEAVHRSTYGQQKASAPATADPVKMQSALNRLGKMPDIDYD
eukprot:6186867-Pleurochrysis_carterae.AAC.2